MTSINYLKLSIQILKKEFKENVEDNCELYSAAYLCKKQGGEKRVAKRFRDNKPP